MLTHSLTRLGTPSWRRQVAVTALTLGSMVAGCTATGGNEAVLDQSGDPKVVYATTKCTIPNADGQRCDEKTCKTDDDGNCEYFASRCLATGHKYTGTADSGTCTREPTGQ